MNSERPLTLYLPLKAVYFNAIRAGTKAEEFRLRNAYWRKRIEGKEFEWVMLTLGYPAADEPWKRLRLPWRGYRVFPILHPEFGPEWVEVFAIDVSGMPA